MKKLYKTKTKGAYKMCLKKNKNEGSKDAPEFDFDDDELIELAESYSEMACGSLLNKL